MRSNSLSTAVVVIGASHQAQSLPFITCTYEEHAEAMLAIFNEAIANSTALYDDKPRTLDSMVSWCQTKETHHFPVLGVTDETDTLLGFASYGTFRAWPAYEYSVEHSVDIHKDHRGQGIGRALMPRSRS